MVDFSAKPGETVILFMRHEDVEWDEHMRSYSDVRFGLDTPSLSEQGKQDSKNIGKTLKKLGVNIDVAVTSPYLRTKQTVQGILEGGGYQLSDSVIVEDAKLGEIKVDGMYERGPTLDQLKWESEKDSYNPAQGHIMGDMYEEHVYNREGHAYTIEMPTDQAVRVKDVLVDIAKKHEGKVVLVMTHGEPGAYGAYQAEIGEGPMPLTYIMKEQLGNRLGRGDGKLMRFSPEGVVLASADLHFNGDGTKLTVEEKFDHREGSITHGGEMLG